MTSQLRNSSDVTIFGYHCVECIKLDTCAKFHDHRSNNNKVIMGGGPSCSPPPMTDGSKKAMSNLNFTDVAELVQYKIETYLTDELINRIV